MGAGMAASSSRELAGEVSFCLPLYGLMGIGRRPRKDGGQHKVRRRQPSSPPSARGAATLNAAPRQRTCRESAQRAERSDGWKVSAWQRRFSQQRSRRTWSVELHVRGKHADARSRTQVQVRSGAHFWVHSGEVFADAAGEPERERERERERATERQSDRANRGV